MSHAKDRIDLQDLISNDQFVQERPHLIKDIITLKAKRRMGLGPHITVLFENRRLIWWQVQEMVRVEQGGQTQAQEELRVYNPLIPSRLRLTMTLMIEIADPVVRHTVLAQLSGLESHVFLSFGDHRIGARTVSMDGDQDPTSPAPGISTSSVHFLSFTMDQEQRDAFDQHLPSLVCDHPLYAHTQALSHDLWTQLKEYLLEILKKLMEAIIQ